MSFLLKRLVDFKELIEKTQCSTLSAPVIYERAQEKVHGLYTQSIKLHQNIFVVGNGGSSGIASHHATDLINVVKAPALALSDSNVLTCMGNDYGYENVFSRPLESLAKKNDILIAISSSGQSKNILNACEILHKKGGIIITLSGFKNDNPLRQLGNVNFWTGVNDYGLVETAHFFILHTLVDAWASKEKSKNQQPLSLGI